MKQQCSPAVQDVHVPMLTYLFLADLFLYNTYSRLFIYTYEEDTDNIS